MKLLISDINMFSHKVKEYAKMAKKAMEENTGSSMQWLNMLMSEISNFTPQHKMESSVLEYAEIAKKAKEKLITDTRKVENRSKEETCGTWPLQLGVL
ncbi:hypothetical protein Q3G72_024622 [Acer saccharum]|nr:hypothetical protein Q3G72_024622 [Acer saccharum]